MDCYVYVSISKTKVKIERKTGTCCLSLCVDNIENKWKDKLKDVGVWIDEHCEKMIQSIGVD